MANLDGRFRKEGLRVIGLHSPELDSERNPENVRREVRELGVVYPVVIDRKMKMWEALDNSYWPAFYLIDRKGRIRHTHVGETHAGSNEAIDFERCLVDLLVEPVATSF